MVNFQINSVTKPENKVVLGNLKKKKKKHSEDENSKFNNSKE